MSEDGAALLSESVRRVQQHSPPTQQLCMWLEQVWSLLQHLVDLKPVVHLPLLPFCSQPASPVDLLPLSQPIVEKSPRAQVNDVMEEALKLLGVAVVSELPPYVDHPSLQCLHRPADAGGISMALDEVVKDRGIHTIARSFNDSRSDAHSLALVAALHSHSFNPQVKSLLAELKLFKASSGGEYEKVNVSIKEVKYITPQPDNFPVHFPELLITPVSPGHLQLALALGGVQLSKKDLCLKALKNEDSGTDTSTFTYSDADISTLAVYIMRDPSLVESQEICAKLKLRKFVVDVNGRFRVANDLFDPEDPNIDALIGEDLTPNHMFRQHLPVLRQIGLRSVKDLLLHELQTAISRVRADSLSPPEKSKKSDKLLRVLEERDDYQQVCEAVRNVPFVYSITDRPSDYPSWLAWAGQPGLLTPTTLKSSSDYKDIVGSTNPLVDCSHLPRVAAGFAWNQDPDITKVLKHFKNILEAYTSVDSGIFGLVKKVYKYLSRFVNTTEEHHLQSLSALPCVFTESGFKPASEVYIWTTPDDLPLLPYMHPLPFVLQEFSELFECLGCHDKQSVQLYLQVLRQVQAHHVSPVQELSVKRDRKMVVSVLEKLEGSVAETRLPQLLFPVECDDDDRLELVETEQCSYPDYDCNWLNNDELELRMVHSCVPPRLAQSLGVKQLSQHLTRGGDEYMDWSQHEPLTTRLHNLLRHYRDGVAVMKELVQNADDAGATSVAFLYDERQNDDARIKLLSAELGQWQGPALWTYNNAKFTENDFDNLKKLGGATKELQSTKIGKFGLGFCSVYNLTDVPSFVSGSSFVILDPHLTNLGPDNKAAGMRYNFSTKRNSLMLRKLMGQFRPFREVFGCMIHETAEYDGTLFRLPLRSQAQAARSQISKLEYGKTDMMNLLCMFRNVIGELLLFTQHVQEIKVFHLPSNAGSPAEKQLLFESSRVMLDEPLGIKEPGTPMTKADALYTRSGSTFEWGKKKYQEVYLSDMSVQQSEAGQEMCGGQQGSSTVTWLISWHSGNGRLCRLAEQLCGSALPLGAVAVPVIQASDGWIPRRLSDLPRGFYTEGYLHCFLPLPVETPLPVQVNGFFDVADDRTNLRLQSTDDRQEQNWNMILAEDAICAAYHTLVHTLVSLGQSTETPYHTHWPLAADGSDDIMRSLVNSFYCSIVDVDPAVFPSSSGWHSMTQCVFLEHSFYSRDMGKIAFEYMENLLRSLSGKYIIELPRDIQAGFDKKWLSSFCISEDKFYKDHFFPSVSREVIATEKRDMLTLHFIDTPRDKQEALRGVPCIPTNPKGKLRAPEDLIKPGSCVAAMYSTSDERFPQDVFLSTGVREYSLSTLGMKSENIPVEWVSERADSVILLPCSGCIKDRTEEILLYLGRLDGNKPENMKQLEDIANGIKSKTFLPVMEKPSDWEYEWSGDRSPVKGSTWCSRHSGLTEKGQLKPVALAAPTELYLPDVHTLIGSLHQVVGHKQERNQSRVSVLRKLGVVTEPLCVPLHSVLQQLDIIAAAPLSRHGAERCRTIYQHFEYFLRQKRNVSLSEFQNLREKKILLTKKYGFAAPEQFVMDSTNNCSPDLFSAHIEGLDRYKNLLKVLGISMSCTYTLVMQTILRKKEIHKTEKLNDAEVSRMSKLLDELFRLSEKNSGKGMSSVSSIYLPDASGVLQPVNKLCFDDGARLSSGDFLCLHRGLDVSLEKLKWLGITSKTRKRLEESSRRMYFGQNEPLTVRLHNLLEDYPCDESIIKELLQNADDAGATEVAFFNDTRHLPTQRLFDKQWASLQGPALLVYNNKGFTAQDLASIQDLGNSSKKEDPAKTGQFGIGFNAVYHLTDAPSFLTRGPDVPHGETLCLFDPHCRYDPFATPDKPGTQLIDLQSLRKDHPDSFLGYKEELLHEEGTVFRLPLRTSVKSDISRKVFESKDLDKMLKAFQSEMSKCLQFLRNVKKVSIMKVGTDNKCTASYCIQSSVIHKRGQLHSSEDIKQHKRDKTLYALDMKRETYQLKFTDSDGKERHWCVVQQLGAETKDTVPLIVKEAFRCGSLNLKPHAGVAILMNSESCPSPDVFTTSCYLPLPVSAKACLPFSINGHFALSACRRGLWEGVGDHKSEWNQWLIREVLVPATIHALDVCRRETFQETEHQQRIMTEEESQEKIASFHNHLPLIDKVMYPLWKSFCTWLYEYLIANEVFFFAVFIPDSDKLQNAAGLRTRSGRTSAAEEARMGVVEWHAFKEKGCEFPIHFVKETPQQTQNRVLDTFKRLGMKTGYDEMYLRLKAAVPNHNYCFFNAATALTFLCSWNKSFPDRCLTELWKYVKETPFLCPENVRRVLSFVSEEKKFNSNIPNLPLLLTNDLILRQFSKSEPVFSTPYASLLPSLGKEFVALILVQEVNKHRGAYEAAGVVSPFTIQHLSTRLPNILDSSYQHHDAMIVINKSPNVPNIKWLQDLWSFVVEAVSLPNFPRNSCKWKSQKDIILNALGSWALYPITVEGTGYLIPINCAWKALDTRGFDANSIFKDLPVPRPALTHIPEELNLAAWDKNPTAVLKVLGFYRDKLKDYMRKVKCDGGHGDSILTYFGCHCKKEKLNRCTLKALKIYKDVTGEFCSLRGKRLIVLPGTMDLNDMAQIARDKNFVILKCASTPIMNLYKYVDEGILMDDVHIYANFVLPNIKLLDQKRRIRHLVEVRDNYHLLHNSSVVSVLKSTKFLELNGKLETADKFYDPSNPVFSVMKVANVPHNWASKSWREFLKLAGMIDTVTCEKFVEFAQSLDSKDPDVQEKSETLIKYLEQNVGHLRKVLSKIKDTEFLMPGRLEKIKKLGKILPHFSTASGLVSFSRSVELKFGNIVWSAVSLLPNYAHSLAWRCRAELGVSNRVPEALILQHFTNLPHAMQGCRDVDGDEVKAVMEDFYKYLCESKVACEMFSNKLVIHIPDHQTFVPASLVVESLEEEILPYLYKAPTYYGKYTDVLRRLGMKQKTDCNTYAQVLMRLYHATQQQELSPAEEGIMIRALNGLLKHELNLYELCVDVLYLPTRTRRLCDASKMFVADNQELLMAAESKIKEPLFLGFAALKIEKDCWNFLKRLPEGLRPKFLSDIVQEELVQDGVLAITSPVVNELREVLGCSVFHTAVLRVINHFKVKDGLGLTEKERMEILIKLSHVHVEQLSDVRVVQRLHGQEIQTKKKLYHVQNEITGNHSRIRLFLPQLVFSNTIQSALNEVYRRHLNIKDTEVMSLLSAVFGIIMKPHDMHRLLDSYGIREYRDQGLIFELYSRDIGSYLDETFLHCLNNEFGHFYTGEIVCMKKYCTEQEDDAGEEDDDTDNLYIIVQVHRLVSRSSVGEMMDEYEVRVDKEVNALITVKAHELYKFISKPVDTLMQTATAKVEEERVDLPEEELRGRLRMQIKKIWRVDTKERRHLLRRLWLRWHPDKNPGRVELCTHFAQYIQTLVARLERGERIPDEDQPDETPSTPTIAYSRIFRPPCSSCTGSYGGGGCAFSSSGSICGDRRRGDRLEARRWWEQAENDLKEAAMRLDGPAAWAMYICHQAAEGFITACLYRTDIASVHQWPAETLTQLALRLAPLSDRINLGHVRTLVRAVEDREVVYGWLRYPGVQGFPSKRYGRQDAQFVLEKVYDLKTILSPIVN